MKTVSYSIPIHLLIACLAMSIVGDLTTRAATTEPVDQSATLQAMQEILVLQNQRIERIYKAVEPFLDQIEREGQQLEQQQPREAEVRDLNSAIDQVFVQDDAQQALDAIATELEKRQAATLQLQHRLFNISGCIADWNRCMAYGKELFENPSFEHTVGDLRSYAAAALLTDDWETYNEMCSQAIQEYGETVDPVTAERTAKLLMLAPEVSQEQLTIAQRLVDAALEYGPDSPWIKLAKGIAEYRENNDDQALSWLAGITTNDNPNIASLAGYFSAMTQQALNHPDIAKEELSTANTHLDAMLDVGHLASMSELWWFNGAASILARAEAEKMILGEETSPRPTMESLAAARLRHAPPKRESPQTLVGQPVPGSFKLILLDGDEFTLPDEKNTNILLLDFWATWCGPCRSMMPVLAQISKDYADRGVRYVAVNLREKQEDIRKYLESANLDITVALDSEGSMAEAFHVHGIPTMVVIDRNNIIRNVHVGASDSAGDELRSSLDELLNEQAPES